MSSQNESESLFPDRMINPNAKRTIADIAGIFEQDSNLQDWKEIVLASTFNRKYTDEELFDLNLTTVKIPTTTNDIERLGSSITMATIDKVNLNSACVNIQLIARSEVDPSSFMMVRDPGGLDFSVTRDNVFSDDERVESLVGISYTSFEGGVSNVDISDVDLQTLLPMFSSEELKTLASNFITEDSTKIQKETAL